MESNSKPSRGVLGGRGTPELPSVQKGGASEADQEVVLRPRDIALPGVERLQNLMCTDSAKTRRQPILD